MWKKAIVGSDRPMATIISPSWLVVEKAIIFLISCCVIAQEAANSAVIAPRRRVVWEANGYIFRAGEMRISKKTPATTMVELWRRAETGVGPSMAAGSHGWRPNWADFPVAARRHPQRKNEMFTSVRFATENNVSNFHLEVRVNSHPAANKIPMSPMRL